MSDSTTTVQQQRTPPYISTPTFFNALDTVVEHGVPQQVDRSVLNKFSGAANRQFVQTARYLGLLDGDKPTDDLKRYAAGDENTRKAILRTAVEEAYPEQVAILPNGTMKQLQASFDAFTIEQSVRQKCVAFLINVAKRIDLPVGQHIAKGSRVRGPKGAPRVKRKDNPAADKGTPPNDIKTKPDEVPQGMALTPIPVGAGKTWRIITPQNYSADEAKRFIDMLKIVLRVKK